MVRLRFLARHGRERDKMERCARDWESKASGKSAMDHGGLKLEGSLAQSGFDGGRTFPALNSKGPSRGRWMYRVHMVGMPLANGSLASTL